jgi:hypothetical protein
MTAEITIENDAGGRHYRTPIGRWPSVSTVLERTAGKRWGLDRWRQGLGEDNAAVVSEIARRRGHVLHREIVHYLTTGETPREVSVWWRSVWPTVRPLRAMGAVVLAERPLVHPLDRYGGTPDLVLLVAGRLVLYDWKTSAEPRPLALLLDYEDQLAGYADLVEWDQNRRPDLALVVVAIPEAPAQVHKVDLTAALPRWRGRLAQYHETH